MMDREDIKAKIIKAAKETIGADLDENESLIESGVDSLALVSLIVSIEYAFDVEFSDDDLQPENLQTLSSLIELTEKYI
ncbi:MAG: phosphopantetheine-binding protein [Christensenellaceae bacterium]